MKITKFIFSTFIFLFTCLIFTTCSEEEVFISKIEISEGDSLEVLLGDSSILTVKHYPSKLQSPECLWFSSDTSIVEIDKYSGKYVAKNVGTCDVTVMYKENATIKATCFFKVKPIDATNIYINPAELNVFVGDTTMLQVEFVPSNTTYQEVVWSSSNTTIAMVKDGKVCALEEGNCIIYAQTSNGIVASCNVVVNSVNVESIELDETEKIIEVGAQFVLTPTITPANATNKNVIWTSSSPEIASVNEYGVVSAIKEGECYIHARTSNQKEAKCHVVVRPVDVESIELNETEKNLEEGEQFELTATITPANATNKNVIWSSSSPEIASVNEYGVVSAIKEGECYIHARTSNQKEAKCKIIVTPIPVESVSITESEVKLLLGESKTIKYNIYPSNAKITDVQWTIDDETIARVSNDGEVTTNAIGETTLTLTVNGQITAKCFIEVCDINEFISIQNGAKGLLVNNGFVLGSSILTTRLINDSPKDIRLKKLELIDARDSYARSQFDLDNEIVRAYSSCGYELTIKLPIYKPIIRWTYIYNGKEYEIEHTFFN